MRFTAPLALLLLLLLPLTAYLGWPSPGYGKRRETLSLIIRLIVLACLVLSLAGMELGRPADNLAVVFLVDISDSMPADAVAAAIDYVEQAIAAMGPDDQAAVIAFGGEALVERPMSSSREFTGLTSIPTTNQTDLAEAIRLALALYPPGAARRMVILSDGVDTVSPASQAGLVQIARLASASGVEIVSLPFIIEPGAEVLISGVEVPENLRQGENFDLFLTLEATQSTRAWVRVLADDQVVFEGAYDLERGSQSFSLPLNAGAPGFTSYAVQVEPVEDGYYQNNELETFAQVAGPPRVLVVAPPEGEVMGFRGNQPRPDEFSALVQALTAAGYSVEVIPPGALPPELPNLAEYDSIVLVDVPARDLSQQQMQAIQIYVRDLGGGLVSVGGPTSYGVGGYFRTPLEETLPLEMQIKDEQRRPTLAMVFIIDHSGSMSDTSGGVTKLELAKEAAIRSVQLLAPMDRLGVIAFDDSASWVVPMTSLENADRVVNAIASIRSGGGTDILAGLQAMAQVFPQEEALVKHVILLTDGGADPSGIPDLVRQLNEEHGITLTTVGVGQDAAAFLPELAEIGGGRYHFAADPGSIPSIFTEETSLATRAYIVEEAFFPRLVNSSPILTGISETPALYGYVGTSVKATARLILITEQDDPLLAAWQYGLGKSVAFTSDATGRWGKEWVSWEGFATFWAQAVRYTISERSSSALNLDVQHQGETARLVVDAADEQGAFLNQYQIQANVVGPSGEVQAVVLEQVAPGRYESTFTPREQGAYLIRLSGGPPPGEPPTSEQSGQPLAETAGWVLSYSPEYRLLASDPDALYRITLQAGGKMASEDPASVFTHDLVAPLATRPVWPWLLGLAALLLPVDIAVRRLVVTGSEIRRFLEKAFGRLAGRRPGTEKVQLPQRSQHMDSLFQAKERSHETRDESHKPIYKQEKPAASPETRRQPAETRPAAASDQPTQESEHSSPPSSTASTLLASKRLRKNRESQEDEKPD